MLTDIVGLGSEQILAASSALSLNRHDRSLLDPDAYEIGCEHLNVQSDEFEYNRLTSENNSKSVQVFPLKLIAIVI